MTLLTNYSKFSKFVFYTFFIISFTEYPSIAKEYFVSKNGDDLLNSGLSVSKTFLTIQHASNCSKMGDTVTVMAGIYREQINIKSDDVLFRPFNNDLVTISGTEPMLMWSLVAGNTYQTEMLWNLSERWGSDQVFVDGKMIDLARWPKQTSADIVMPTNATADKVSQSGNLITILDLDFNAPPERWVGAKIWINLARGGHDGQGWTGDVVATNKNSIIVDFRGEPRLGDQPWGLGEGTEYYLFNPTPKAVERTGGVDALLSPGEWWKNGNSLYVKCLDGDRPSSLPSGKNLTEVKKRYFGFWSSKVNAGYTIRDFNLFACTITTDPEATTNRSIRTEAHDITIDGLKVLYPSHISIMDGSFQDRQYAWSGVVINGVNNTIKNCDIKYSAASAISIQGKNIKVVGNSLGSTNYICSNAGSLNTGFICVDAEIAYNKIYNTTVMGINFKYAQNSDPNKPDKFRIHHNEIFDFMRRSGDSGAIDMVGADLQWARIDHNLIYNTLLDAKLGMLKHGIYLDFGDNGENIRATVDHNVIYNVTTPLLVNDGRKVNVFNNVLLSHGIGQNSEYSIGNFNGKSGDEIKIYNNIMSGPPNLTGCCGDFSNSDLRNNIIGLNSEMLNQLFVNPANHNYKLKETAKNAIDRGISVGIYDEHVEGIPDIGAFEYGTLMQSPDLSTPSIPVNISFSDVNSKGFKLTWDQATDNLGVVSYDIYLNGTFYQNVTGNTFQISNLIPTTNYKIELAALDASGNKSYKSMATIVKTNIADAEIWKVEEKPPIIDGLKDAIWQKTKQYTINKKVDGISNSKSLLGNWSALWDDENFYLAIQVNDTSRNFETEPVWYKKDRVEFYIDAEGDGDKNYGDKDFQFYITPRDTVLSEVKHNATNGAIANINFNNDGYFIEAKIPFNTLGINPKNFEKIGFDILIADEIASQISAKSMWFTTSNRAYSNPSVLGILQLKKFAINDTKNPSIPKHLKVLGQNPNGFELRWKPSKDNFYVKDYEIFLDDNLWETTPYNNVIIENLPPQKSYKVNVKAKDASGNSSKLSRSLYVSLRTDADVKIFEAENGKIGLPAEIAFNNKTDYYGKGYVTGYSDSGAYVTFNANVETGGFYDVILRYSKASSDLRKLLISLNGKYIKDSILPPNKTDGFWRLKTERLKLTAGNNQITYTYADSKKDGMNLDCIMIYTPILK